VHLNAENPARSKGHPALWKQEQDQAISRRLSCNDKLMWKTAPPRMPFSPTGLLLEEQPTDTEDDEEED
jgi:hypothetical protein